MVGFICHFILCFLCLMFLFLLFFYSSFTASFYTKWVFSSVMFNSLTDFLLHFWVIDARTCNTCLIRIYLKFILFNDRNHIKLPLQFSRNVLYYTDINEEYVNLKSLVCIDLSSAILLQCCNNNSWIWSVPSSFPTEVVPQVQKLFKAVSFHDVYQVCKCQWKC